MFRFSSESSQSWGALGSGYLVKFMKTGSRVESKLPQSLEMSSCRALEAGSEHLLFPLKPMEIPGGQDQVLRLDPSHFLFSDMRIKHWAAS